jgi:hypothetical protein
MCYWAEARTLYDNCLKEFGADIDIREAPSLLRTG